MAVKVETARLLLRELTEGDLPLLRPIMTDAITMRYYPWRFDEERLQGWLRNSLASYRVHGYGRWAVIRREDGAFLGDCGVTWHELDGEELPELGYRLFRAHWRQGYGAEAARAVRDWMFQNTDLPALYSFMMVENLASAATARKNGMTLLKQFYHAENGESFLYGITREEWEALMQG